MPNLKDAIYLSGDVIITTTLAKFSSQTFPINGIGSVTLVPPKSNGLFLFGGLAFFVGICSLFDPIACCTFLLISFFLFFLASKKMPSLWIKTASGDVRAMQHSDRLVLQTIKEAIEKAATLRG